MPARLLYSPALANCLASEAANQRSGIWYFHGKGLGSSRCQLSNTPAKVIVVNQGSEQLSRSCRNCGLMLRSFNVFMVPAQANQRVESFQPSRFGGNPRYAQAAEIGGSATPRLCQHSVPQQVLVQVSSVVASKLPTGRF